VRAQRIGAVRAVFRHGPVSLGRLRRGCQSRTVLVQRKTPELPPRRRRPRRRRPPTCPAGAHAHGRESRARRAQVNCGLRCDRFHDS
jgi:hypothetical protein